MGTEHEGTSREDMEMGWANYYGGLRENQTLVGKGREESKGNGDGTVRDGVGGSWQTWRLMGEAILHETTRENRQARDCGRLKKKQERPCNS